MHKKMIPFFLVPLLATSALASEQTGLAAPASNNALPKELHSLINEQMKDGAPSDSQNAIEKVLVIKEVLAKTDKVFTDPLEFETYMTKVKEWHAKLHSVQLNGTTDISRYTTPRRIDLMKYTSRLIININSVLHFDGLESDIKQFLESNPTLHVEIKSKSYSHNFKKEMMEERVKRINDQYKNQLTITGEFEYKEPFASWPGGFPQK